MILDLTKNSAYSDKTPYEVWQETEGVPIHKGLAIDDLTTAGVGSWKRKGASGAFINMLGAGRSCDSYICEIPAQGQTLPERYLFEELIFVVKGRGATSVWTENGRKQTFEGQQGNSFWPPLKHWRQHFDVERDDPSRCVARTDAPLM